MKKLSDPRTTLETVSRYDFDFHKRFGQNFLVDEGVILRSLEAAGVGKTDVVFEVGPGIGTLTQYLSEAAAHVVSIEIDKKLIPILTDTLDGCGNVEVINEDVLKVDLPALARRYHAGRSSGLSPLKIVANLPYYITTPILMNLFRQKVPAQSITVMVQKEVADRIESGPGSKAYGAISVAVQYYADVSRIVSVPKEVFLPSPKVDSAVLLLELRETRAVQPLDETQFFACVRAGFGQRRKTLSNALCGAGKIPKETVREALSAAGIDESRRAETLSIEEFARIADELTTREGSEWKRTETN